MVVAGTLLRLGFVKPDDTRNVLVLLVRHSPASLPTGRVSRSRNWSRTSRPKLRPGCGREYAAHDDVLSVRLRSTERVSVGGAPSLRWIADLRMKSGRVVRIQRTECFAGRLRFTFLSWTALGSVAARREFARVVESLDYRVTWGPSPHDGKVWGKVPSRPRDRFAIGGAVMTRDAVGREAGGELVETFWDELAALLCDAESLPRCTRPIPTRCSARGRPSRTTVHIASWTRTPTRSAIPRPAPPTAPACRLFFGSRSLRRCHDGPLARAGRSSTFDR